MLENFINNSYEALLTVVKSLFSLFSKIVSLILVLLSPLGSIFLPILSIKIGKHIIINWLALLVNKIPWLHRWANKLAINALSNVRAPRPGAYSMWTPDTVENIKTSLVSAKDIKHLDYSCWDQLTNKSFNARHLPPVAEYLQDPPLRELASLLVAKDSQSRIKEERSSALFPAFAQWFTDSFLRSTWHDFRKNTSNHQIDLCQIYGLDQATTEILREKKGGLLKYQLINDNEFPPFLFVRNSQANIELTIRSRRIIKQIIKLCAKSPAPTVEQIINSIDSQQDSLILAKVKNILDTEVANCWGASIAKLLSAQEFSLLTYLNDNFAKLPSALDIVSIYETMYSARLESALTSDEAKVLNFENLLVGGLDRVNTTPGYSAINILFWREHNRICGELAKHHSDWDDERLFQTARNINIVELLNVVVEDYIKHISGSTFNLKADRTFAEQQTWYRENWIAIEFNLLYRWHCTVRDDLTIGRYYLHTYGKYQKQLAFVIPEWDKQFFGLNEAANQDNTSNDNYAFYNQPDKVKVEADNNLIKEYMLLNNSPLLDSTDNQDGLAVTIDALANHNSYKFKPYNIPKYMDDIGIVSTTLWRSRTAKLQSFNEYRKAFRLPAYKRIEDITSDQQVQQKLKQLYGNDVNKVELFVGLFAEESKDRILTGELLTRMVSYDAFTQALTNPLLADSVWGKNNEKAVNNFSVVGLDIIKNTSTLSDIFNRNVKNAKDYKSSFGL